MLTEAGCLSQEARKGIWRIFASGESPLTEGSTYDLIPAVIAAEVSGSNRDGDTVRVQAWFEQSRYGWSLKQELKEVVAGLILDGLEIEEGGAAVWAVSAVSAEVMAPLIRLRWNCRDIQTFFDASVVELQKACDHDVVLDPTRWGNIEPDKAKDAHVSKTAVMQEGRLRTFDHLDRWVPDPVLYGVRPAIANLLILALDLCPEDFLEVVRRLDHPVLQYHLSWRWRSGSRPQLAEEPLEWISRDAGDTEIALAIWEILGDVKSLGPTPMPPEDVGCQTGQQMTRSAGTPANSQAARDRLRELVKRLAQLDGRRRTRWIGELLGYAPWAVGESHGGSKPAVVETLDGYGCDFLRLDIASCPLDVWLQDLRAGLQSGGARRPLRHEAVLAWTVRTADRGQAVKLATCVLEEYRRYTNEENRHIETDWNNWIDREAAQAMGKALALGCKNANLHEWVVAWCQELPLSVWDAGENIRRFWDAERIAEDGFLIAFMAVAAADKLGEPSASDVIQRLAQLYWEHRRFVDQYGWKERTSGFVTEIVARHVVHFAQPSDEWILGQANSKGAGARALWGLLDQREREQVGEANSIGNGRQEFSIEMLRIAKRRFVEEEPCDLSSLEFWGYLWMHLHAVDQAEETASKILRSESQPLERRLEILALRLLSLVTKARTVAGGVLDRIVPLYTRLWPAHTSTPEEEQRDRDEIAEALVTAGLLSQSGRQ